MAKNIPSNWGIKLTPEQYKAIDWFIDNPPKYFRWFIPFFKKVLSKIIYVLLIVCIVLAVICNIVNAEMFDLIKSILFIDFGIAAYALLSHLAKVFYTKRYAKKIGLSLKEWDWVTIGQSWDI